MGQALDSSPLVGVLFCSYVLYIYILYGQLGFRFTIYNRSDRLESLSIALPYLLSTLLYLCNLRATFPPRTC